MSLKERYNSLSSETKGCWAISILLFITLPSLFTNFMQCSTGQKEKQSLLAKIDSLERAIPNNPRPDSLIIFITKDNELLGTNLPASRVPDISIEVVDEK